MRKASKSGRSVIEQKLHENTQNLTQSLYCFKESNERGVCIYVCSFVFCILHLLSFIDPVVDKNEFNTI